MHYQNKERISNTKETAVKTWDILKITPHHQIEGTVKTWCILKITPPQHTQTAVKAWYMVKITTLQPYIETSKDIVNKTWSLLPWGRICHLRCVRIPGCQNCPSESETETHYTWRGAHHQSHVQCRCRGSQQLQHWSRLFRLKYLIKLIRIHLTSHIKVHYHIDR